MSDEWDWGDIGDIIVAAVVVAGAYAVQGAISSAVNGKKDAQQGMYASKQGVPATTNLVGDFSRVAGKVQMWDSNGQAMVKMQAIHNGRIAELPPRWWLHDDEVSLNAPNGYVTAVIDGPNDGRYTNAGSYLMAKLGLPTEAKYTDPFLDRFPYYWNDPNWRGDNTATILGRFIMPGNRGQIFPGGAPEISCAARPVVYDWRKDSTAGGAGSQRRDDDTTWGPCPNPVVWTVHKAWTEWGADWGRQIAPVLAALTAEADYCDQPVMLKGGGTEPRYRCAGFHEGTDTQATVLGLLLATFDGYYDFDARGRLVVLAGRVDTDAPIITGEMVTGWSWEHGVYTEDAVGEIVTKFQSPAHKYNDVECDPWPVNPLATNSHPFDIPWVKWLSQARRLSKREADRVLPRSRGTITMGRRGRQFSGKRYLRIQNPEEPLMANALCEVIERTQSADGGTYTFVLREVSPAIDNWNAETEEGNPIEYVASAPGEPLSAPVIDDADPLFDGGVVRVNIDATGPDRSDLTWFTSWRIGASGVWSDEMSSASGGIVSINTAIVPQVADLQVRVFYRTGRNEYSPESDPVTVNTTTAFVPPAQVSEISKEGGAGQAVIGYRAPTSSNFGHARIYRNTVNDFGTATQVGGNRSVGLGAMDSYTDTPLSAGTYWYWVTTVNTSNVEGDPYEFGSVTVT